MTREHDLEHPASTAHRAAAVTGLSTRGTRLLRDHGTAVFHLPAECAVARVATGPDAAAAAERAVAITRWLGQQDFPAVQPLSVEQPVRLDAHTVTFWQYHPQPANGAPNDPAHLARLLRRLHALPQPPVELPAYRPLAHFTETVRASTRALTEHDRDWLLTRTQELLDEYTGLEFPLGVGHIHGDAYPGNLLHADHDRVLLADWDETATGPRELDLVNTYQGTRYGRTTEQLQAFSTAYGYDITTWSGFPVLRALRDLHTLGSFIRHADNADHTAAAQLAHRLSTLRAGDDTALWVSR